MNNSKHTEGPWGIASRNYDRGDTLIATFPEGKPIAKVKRMKGNNWANAHLIYSAPDLLAALESAYAVLTMARVEVYNHDRANYAQLEKAIDQVSAAIAKATGK